MLRRKGRDPHLERRWRNLIVECQRSGQTVRDFCRDQDLSEPSFYAWRREIARRDRVDRKAPPAAPTFVPVRVMPVATIEVVLTSGLIVRVPGDADAAAVAQLVAALGAMPC